MSQLEMNYAPFAPEVMAEPSVAYEYLHANPVHLCTEFDPPFYTLSRHADVSMALRDIERFSSTHGQGPRFTPPAGMLSDPPQHTHFRALVQRAFTPKAINAMAQRVYSLADELLSQRNAGGWDLHDDFAFPLPVIVISDLLGVPSEDLHLFKRWSDASVAAMGSEDPTQYAADMSAMGEYLLSAIEQRRAHPGTDLISRLVQAKSPSGEQLEDESVLSVITQLLVGGNETTTSLITNAAWRMLEQPVLWHQFSSDGDTYIPAAIEESLRFDPPVLGLYRTVTEDVELHGTTMAANSKVMLHYAAANRDPAVYDQPDEFRLDRESQRHLSFGLGVHFCLGAQLARLEASACLSALARTCPELTLAGDTSRIAPFFLWGRRHLPVEG